MNMFQIVFPFLPCLLACSCDLATGPGARAASALRIQMKQQPEGQRERRPIARSDREKVAQKAEVAYRRSAIPEAAYKFLTEWAKGTLRRHPRPQSYSFLAFYLSLNTI